MRRTVAGLVPILHRDMKPANVFLKSDPRQDYPVIKLGDFGLASYLDRESLEMFDEGTPAFEPPELYACHIVCASFRSLTSTQGLQWAR